MKEDFWKKGGLGKDYSTEGLQIKWTKEKNFNTLHVRSQIKQAPTFSNGFTLESANQRGKIGRFGFGGRIWNRHIPLKPQLRACSAAPAAAIKLPAMALSISARAHPLYIGICSVFTCSSTFLLSLDSFKYVTL